MLEDKEIYTLRELIESLPCSLRQFGKDSKISEVTIARIRDGKPAIRSTINRLLMALSSVYGRRFTQRNVQGILIRGEAKNAEAEPKVDASTKGPMAQERPWYLPEQKEKSTGDKSEPGAA
jgi:transcriptional regulator with XRE-family HTH domain